LESFVQVTRDQLHNNSNDWQKHDKIETFLLSREELLLDDSPVFLGMLILVVVNLPEMERDWDIYNYQNEHPQEDWRVIQKKFFPAQQKCFYFIMFLPIIGIVVELIARYLNKTFQNRMSFVYGISACYGIPYMLSFMNFDSDEISEQSYISGIWPLQQWYTHLIMACLVNSRGPLNDFVQAACMAAFLVAAHNTGTMQIFCLN
jgi:hypothetical protein